MSGRGGGGQDRCERRSKVFVKTQNKNIFFGGAGGVGERGRVGGWGLGSGWGGGGGGVRMDVNEELKFL